MRIISTNRPIETDGGGKSWCVVGTFWNGLGPARVRGRVVVHQVQIDAGHHLV